MKADGLLVITAIVFIFLAWVATGGPSRPISSAGPFITPVTRSGETSQGYRVAAPSNSVNGTAYPSQVGNSGSAVRTNLYSYGRTGGSTGRTAGSSGTISIQHLSAGPSASTPAREYVVLSALGGTDVSITGWTLSSSRSGKRVSIPGGTEVAHSGAVNAATAVMLHPGDIAYIATGVSPIGASFRENSCTGYLGQFQSYVPALAQSCPTPSTEVSRYYRGSDAAACSASISNFSRCVLPSTFAGAPSTSCSSFATQYLNYNGCVNAHQSDSGFRLPIWRIYLGQPAELWGPSPETITLRDQNGNVIDSYSY